MQEKAKKKRRIRPGLSDPDQIVSTPESIRREKDKARHLRQSAWWMRKIGAGVCYYCRKKVESKNLTMDHVIPLSRGGKSQKGNIVPSCKDCNNKKKYLVPVEWEEYLSRLADMEGQDP